MKARKVIRTVAAVTAAAVIAGGAANIANASTADDRPAIEIVSENSADDGLALFTGIYFAQGQVGEYLTDTLAFSDPDGELAANSTPEALETVAEITDAIAAGNPGFFAAFSEDLRSGDPRRVESALERGIAEIDRYVEAADAEVRSDMSGLCIGNVFAVVNVFTVAAAVNIAAVYTAVKYWAPSIDGEPLDRDAAVAELTTVLRAA
ncbi:hypothetical protein ACGFX7_21990 [Streptomyces harbinensis]|uniref:hypothetical protein n=1 Tax=Streptomyces harbinensis TaxID=1176198 RepID=UPI0037214299